MISHIHVISNDSLLALAHSVNSISLYKYFPAAEFVIPIFFDNFAIDQHGQKYDRTHNL